MSSAPAGVATRVAPQRVERVARDLSQLLRDGVEASLSSIVRALGDADPRSERRAALAVAAAALRAYGIRPEPGIPVPKAAVAAASEAIGSLDEFDRDDIATALAATFEGVAADTGGRQEGVVYTPPDVVRFMVREALGARIASALEIDHDEARAAAVGAASLDDAGKRRLGRLLGRLRVVDPAAGAGAFVAMAANEISSLAALLRTQGVPVSPSLATPRLALERCCHGFEVDPDATRMAGAVLAFACSGSRVRTVPKVVATRNTLLGDLDHPSAGGGWDIVLMNPPYIGEKYLRERLGNEFRQALRARDGFSGDLLSHFLLRAIEGLRPDGALSAIVSDTAFTMASAAPVRAALLDRTTLFSLAWCRPFSVAAQGGIVTATRASGGSPSAYVRCFDAERSGNLTDSHGRKTRANAYGWIPGRPLFRPSAAAVGAARRWRDVDELERVWRGVVSRRPVDFEAAAAMQPGEWTLLGAAVRAGQGLATGDDRRFVGLLAGTDAARAALDRQQRIVAELRDDPSQSAAWRRVKRLMGRGRRLDEALVALLDGDEEISLAGRKPFRVVERERYRRAPLSEGERRDGIAEGPAWIPYETSDRSGASGGTRWTRENPVAIDWSAEAVALLHVRREGKAKRPVLRHEELWFRGGVTHNRVASYLRARLMPPQAIFSSESPCYVPAVPWLSELSLLALLNSPVIEFVLKTFLATRNHFELGHLLRIPVPVLSDESRKSLEELASAAVGSTRSREGVPAIVERELDLLTRNLYGVRENAKLPVPR